MPIAGPVPISPNAVEIRPSTRPHLPPPAPPHRPAPRHESLRFTVSHVTTQADGTVTFRATVPGPGHIEVLETAPDDNPARIAALMQPGAHRYAFARGLTTAHSASTVDMRVKPSVRGKLLLRNHPAHVTLRLWVTYLPAVGRPHRVVIHDLHLPCLGDPDHDGDCDAPPN